MDDLNVKVLFFGAARDATGCAEAELSLPSPCNSATALEQVLNAYPELRRFGRSLLFAVNQEYADPKQAVHDGDELAVFPPVSGGGEIEPLVEASPEQINTNNGGEGATPAEDPSPDFFEITTDPIDTGEVARRVVLPHCGATVTLDGYAREWTRGRHTLYLVYEAYAPMALSEMRRLGQEAHQRFDIAHIGIVHRTGKLAIGETSVVIAVGAPHRRAAFEACEWAIRELKRTVPIWKKEYFEDGEVWVEGEGDRG